MPIPRPVTKTIISSTLWGIPITDAVNGIVVPSVQKNSVADITVAAGATQNIFDKTWTVGPSVKSLTVWATITTNSTSSADLLLKDASGSILANVGIPNINGIGLAMMAPVPVVAGSVRVTLSIFAWAGAAVSVIGGKSQVMIQPSADILAPTATVIP